MDGPWALEHLRYAKTRTEIDFLVADLGDLSDIATGQAVGALAWRSLHTRTESPEALSRAIGELSRVLTVGAVALISVRGDASVIGDQPQIRRTEVRNMTRTDYYFGPPSLRALFPLSLEVIRPIDGLRGTISSRTAPASPTAISPSRSSGAIDAGFGPGLVRAGGGLPTLENKIQKLPICFRRIDAVALHEFTACRDQPTPTVRTL